MAVIFFDPKSFFKVILTLEKVGLKLPRNLPWYFYNIGPWRLFSQTHNYYNHLQKILKQEVFTKVIKMPSSKAWVDKFYV
jgi:hypothetical protein